MPKIWHLLLCVALLTTAAPLKAEDSEVATRGTYCSATTSDGTWAFSFGPYDVFYQCNRVRNALAFSSSAPITGVSRGYYWLNALNRVSLRCAATQLYYQGFGNAPLQSAYNDAAFYNGQGCLFSVY